MKSMASLSSRLIGAVHHVVRVESRFPALCRARLLREGAPPLLVSLRNVSPSGFMAIAPGPVRAGSRVRLELAFGGEVEADVRWCLNGHIGCRLRTPFGAGQLALLVVAGGAGALLSARGLYVAAAAAGLMWLMLG